MSKLLEDLIEREIEKLHAFPVADQIKDLEKQKKQITNKIKALKKHEAERQEKIIELKSHLDGSNTEPEK